jgi:DNA-binding response OmpR family regulator
MTTERQKILVVDDDQTVRNLLQRILEKAGYDVVIAVNGQEALEKVSQSDLSLILLDIIMPGLDGFEVLDHIRQYENIPVIMLSGIQEVPTKIDTLTLGADDYITKPFS